LSISNKHKVYKPQQFTSKNELNRTSNGIRREGSKIGESIESSSPRGNIKWNMKRK